MTQKQPPNTMAFTELLREWIALDTQCGRDRDDAYRHDLLESEINRRTPAEDFT